MKGLQLTGHGDPSTVIELVELDDLGSPAPDEIVIDVLATPIEPTDLLMIAGTYGYQPTLPHGLGAQGVGRVAEVGDAVTHLREGDLTLVPLFSGAWTQQIKSNAPYLRPLPDADPNQLSMLGINPLTAHILLTEVVTAEPGDWVIQNAANSAVGRSIVALAASRGVRTVNIVRRPEAVDEITRLGGDVVLIDGPNLSDRIAATTDGANIEFAFDAVGGDATPHLLQSIASHGTVVVYGDASTAPFTVFGSELVYQSQNIRSFWLPDWFAAQTDNAAISSAYEHLAPLIEDGTIHVPVIGTFALDEYLDALPLAAQQRGKVIFIPGQF
jgi:NADPH:quinone reductase-like Zn-dependent oxidoreductase